MITGKRPAVLMQVWYARQLAERLVPRSIPQPAGAHHIATRTLDSLYAGGVIDPVEHDEFAAELARNALGAVPGEHVLTGR